MKKKFVLVFALVLFTISVILSACGPADQQILGETTGGDYVSEALNTEIKGSSIGAGIFYLFISVVIGAAVFSLLKWLSNNNAEGAPGLGSSVLLGVLTFSIVFGAIVFSTSYQEIETGHVAVVVRQGNPVDTLNRGPHWIIPFLEKLVIFPTREFTFITVSDPETRGSEHYRTYEMKITTAEGVKGTVPFLVRFQMDPTYAIHVYEEYGTLENAIMQLIKTPTLSMVRDVVRGKTALDVVTKIDTFNESVEEELRQEMEPNGLILHEFSFRKPDLGPWETERDATETAKQTALKNEQEALATKAAKEAEKYAAEINAEIVREKAKGDADAAVTQAEGQAQVTQVNADAEAYAISAKALAEAEANKLVAESVTTELIEYYRWLQWNGEFPSTYLQGSGENLLLNVPTP